MLKSLTIPVHDMPALQWVREVLAVTGVRGDLKGGFLRDWFAGVPYRDIDIDVGMQGDVETLAGYMRDRGIGYSDLRIRSYTGIRVHMHGTDIDFINGPETADFDINNLRASLDTGEIFETSDDVGPILEHIALKQAMCHNYENVRASRFAKLVRDGYSIIPTDPEEYYLTPQQAQGFAEVRYHFTACWEPSRLPQVRALLREKNAFLLGANAFVVAGTGPIMGIFEDEPLQLTVVGKPGTDLDLVAGLPTPLVVDTDEFGRTFYLELTPFDPDTYYSPVTLGYVPISYDGQPQTRSIPALVDAAQDLMDQKLVFCTRPELGDSIIDVTQDNMYRSRPPVAMTTVGLLVGIGFTVSTDLQEDYRSLVHAIHAAVQ